jgi:ABC-type nitrate/sulfonate/bicarbonate transport system ATPase subunit/ABC-type nitrate/sulfonate/bicarbonate transport system permease component
MKRTVTAGILGIVLLVAAWTGLSAILGGYLVPAPWTAVGEAIRLLSSSFAWVQIGITLLRVTVGFAIALVLGTVVGMVTAKPFIAALVKPLLILMQGMPPILWAIPLILILGFGGAAPIVVIALICFPLIAFTIGEGMRTVPESLKGMLAVYAGGLYSRIRELYFPHLAPFLASALHLGLSLAIKASVVAEYFGASDGVGFQIQTAYQAFKIKRLFGWAVILVTCIVIADRLLRRAPRRSGKSVDASSPHIGTTDPEVSNSLSAIREQFLHPSPSNRLELSDVTFGYAHGRARSHARSNTRSYIRSHHTGNDSRDRTRLTPTVEHISLSVKYNEIAVISGDSGIGKTTLLSLCSGLRTPDSGIVSTPKRLGFVFQDDRFLPWRTCLYNVALPLMYGTDYRRDAFSFGESMLDEVGLIGYRDRYPDELSGGMKKRLSFARCFTALPEAIILDEPFSGLDSDARRALWNKFADLSEQHPVPVIVVTHFPEEVPDRLEPTFYQMTGRPASLIVRA